MTRITMNLSVKSIQNAIKQIENYQTSLNRKAELLAKKLAERGVDVAKSYIVDMDAIFTGELKNSLRAEKKDSDKENFKFAVVADSKHAIFVEVGTGTVGAATPYPGKLPVMYAQGKHFVTLEHSFGKYPAGTYGWFYERDGKVYFTEGMPSRPFMYKTGLDLRKIVGEVAKEVFESE